jgi:hypothetical protein
VNIDQKCCTVVGPIQGIYILDSLSSPWHWLQRQASAGLYPARLRYSLLPTITIIVSIMAGLAGGSTTHALSYPASFNVRNNSVARGDFASLNMCISIPRIKSNPISGRCCGGFVAIPPSGQLIHIHPDSESASAISIAKFSASAEQAADTANVMPGNTFIRLTNDVFCSVERCLGANRVSSAMILACWSTIVDCWDELKSASFRS